MTIIVTKSVETNPSTKGQDGRGTDYAALLRAAQGGNQAAMERLLMKAQEIAYRFSLLVCGHATTPTMRCRRPC